MNSRTHGSIPFASLAETLGLMAAFGMVICLIGCKGSERQDTVIASAANPSHTLRATVILRQYYVDGKFDTSPTTYVLLDQDTGKPEFGNGQEFKPSQVVMQPSQCGPLSVDWPEENVLRITCEKCGLALSALGPHASGLGRVRIDYEGFPTLSSWETAPLTH
jgi:hypothetical protein